MEQFNTDPGESRGRNRQAKAAARFEAHFGHRQREAPGWLYRRIALVALLLSFLLPVSALLGMAATPGSGVAAAPLDTFLTMLVMHIVAYLISVPLFTRLTREG